MRIDCDGMSRGGVAIGKPERQVRKASHWQQATIEITRHDHSSRTLVVMFNRSQVSIGRDSTPQSLSSLPLASAINCSSGSQALLEVTHQDHSIGINSIIVCSRHINVGVVVRAHPVRGESHIRHNVN